MTDATFTPEPLLSFDRGRLSQRHSTWTVAGAGAVTLGVLVGSWLIDRPPHAAPAAPVTGSTARLAAAFRIPPARPLPDLPPSPAARPAPSAGAAAIAPVATASTAPAIVRLAVDAALLDPSLAKAPASALLPGTAPTPSGLAAAEPAPDAAEAGPRIALIAPLPEEPHDTSPVPLPVPPPSPQVEAPQAGAVPLPMPRPAFAWPAPEQDRPARRALARNTDTAPTPAAPGPVAAAAPSDNRGFLDKFFGAFRPSGSALGYAAPEDGLFGRAGLPGGPATPHDRYTAVYDIAAHTVYMPDGSKLEAHSGLGGMMDNPRHVTVRNTGPTPPHLYDLTLRESLFHGVQALRLNPVGGGGVFGRDGLLAHTYMLGPNGQSNGCVSFRDYQAFLRAYQNGQVKRLVVVAGGAG